MARNVDNEQMSIPEQRNLLALNLHHIVNFNFILCMQSFLITFAINCGAVILLLLKFTSQSCHDVFMMQRHTVVPKPKAFFRIRVILAF